MRLSPGANACGVAVYLPRPGAPRPTVCVIAPKTGIALYWQATLNSSGAAARIGASGSRSLTAGDMTFTVEGLPPAQFGFFIVSESRSFLQGLGGGDGNLCLGQPLYRWNFEIMLASPQGEIELVSDLTTLPFGVQPTAGETWHFQYWTRDFETNPPTNTSNTSNAVSVTFTP